MVGIVLGLVEAGSRRLVEPDDAGCPGRGRTPACERSSTSRPGRRSRSCRCACFASGTRTTANVSRGLIYAGMYGMFFFLGQFLQDVEGYSPLRTGLCFLPVPASVFLSSQLVSKVLVDRVRPKVLMMSGIGLTVVSLLLSSQAHAGASYPRILVSLVLLGLGSGTALVPLTTAVALRGRAR